MRITFILPCHSWKPVGGFKVAFEYANHLAQRDHEVVIALPRIAAGASTPLSHVTSTLRYHVIRLIERRRGSWLLASPKVHILSVPDLNANNIPDGDVVFATAWETAEAIAAYPASKGKKMYLVYDLEVWMTASATIRQRMSETYRAGFTLISTSRAVESLLHENRAIVAAQIPAGIDLSNFQIRVPIENRQWGSVGFPIRKARFKGAADAIKAMEILRRRFGESISITAFGPESVSNLPRWIRYLKYPSDSDLADFYNSISIFVLPSHYEGWGLPGVEALACGAALVCTESGGVDDYAFDGVTARLVPKQRPDMIAAGVAKLLEDDASRRQMALNGWSFVQQYTWQRAADALEEVMKKSLKHRGAPVPVPTN
jgi:glycosyltransferase involved in cell wall biosynthesis